MPIKRKVRGFQGEKVDIQEVTKDELLTETKNFGKLLQQTRKNQKNDFASTPKKDWRRLGTIPVELLSYLEKDGVFDNKRNLHKFFRENPQYRVAKKI